MIIIFQKGCNRYATYLSHSFRKIINFKNLDFYIFLRNNQLQIHDPLMVLFSFIFFNELQLHFVHIGILGGLGWSIWSSVQMWRGRTYVWRCLAFVLFTALTMLLELSDFPPLFHIWDAHALWHLSTAPLPFLLYRYLWILMC